MSPNVSPNWPYGAPTSSNSASTPPAPALSIDETIRALKTTDELLSGFRSDLDNAARGRRYADIQKLATKIQEAAKTGQQRTGELEQLQAARKR